MKKLYFLLLLGLLGPVCLRAQQADSLRFKLDYLFAHLDKSQVPTGRLDAYATPWLPLSAFNGTLADSTRTTPAVFRALYATAYTASIYGPNMMATLPSYNSTVAAAETTAGAGTIPVMAQLITYATVRPDAFSQNLLTLQSQQVYDVAGRPASPYSLRSVFAVAPTREFSATGNVALVFPASLYVQLGNYASQPLLAVDFGDGRGYVAATWDQPISAAYSTSGTKRIKVRFTQQQGAPPAVLSQDYFSQFDLFVATPATNALRTASVPSMYFGPQPGQAAGTAYFHYGTDPTTGAMHTTLVKPFIVAEGYDRSYIAPHTAKNYSIDDFLKEIATSRGTTGFDLRNALESVGDYDIVFIDYANGTDDILLNAGLFKAVLDYVNKNKDPASTEQNVVMGMSMGGLIARYKLAEMEKSAPGSTNTRLLVLQDSPQRGANIPLGLSALIRQAQLSFGTYTSGDIDATLKEANALLDQPATKQLLLYQTTLTPQTGPGGFPYNTIDYTGNSFIEGPYRAMVNYAAPYKIVAVSQGSQCGVGLFAPYTELIRVSGYFNLFNLPFIFAGSNGLSGEVVVNAIPANGQANRVSGIHLVEQTQAFFGLVTLRADVVRDNFNCPSGLLPLDGTAGGTEPIGNAIGSNGGFLAGSAYGHSFVAQYTAVPTFSFIPIPSALDVNDFTLPALSAKYIKGISSFSNSRTNGFLAQEQTNLFSNNDFNVPHLTFTARNGEFIFDQMEGKQLASNYCSTECLNPADLVITGPTTLCGTGTYNTPVQGPDVTYIWTASPASAFTVSSGSGPSFSTSNVGDGSGTITLQIGGNCPLTLTKSVKTGTPDSPSFDGPTEVACTDYSETYTITNYGPDVNYTVRSGGVARSKPVLPRVGTFQVLFSGPGSGYVNVTASNTCGTVTNTLYVTVDPCASSYAVYPNPASSQLTVASTKSTADFDADLYDTYGKKVKTIHGDHGKAVFKIDELPEGLYNLRVGQGKDAYSQHIQVKH
ncbi:hypothetical protein GCM10023172_43240 [Hymenobacter ginsengisoli]|uniref:Secretion system C-terminal sorting domain-containing protein n=1 Tax=Hymenobacter ginsengisoli TaxID=1051626 RepID=A0ABP8QSG9_9BACT|nr:MULTISPECIES: T9SS type A sorting domain-containing protein [unclassified Hymenobacter]MBO2033476.1 T9SS type A sorting domain-containing protein [Hymenobacter sp. BT559]